MVNTIMSAVTPAYSLLPASLEAGGSSTILVVVRAEYTFIEVAFDLVPVSVWLRSCLILIYYLFIRLAPTLDR